MPGRAPAENLPGRIERARRQLMTPAREEIRPGLQIFERPNNVQRDRHHCGVMRVQRLRNAQRIARNRVATIRRALYDEDLDQRPRTSSPARALEGVAFFLGDNAHRLRARRRSGRPSPAPAIDRLGPRSEIGNGGRCGLVGVRRGGRGIREAGAQGAPRPARGGTNAETSYMAGTPASLATAGRSSRRRIPTRC